MRNHADQTDIYNVHSSRASISSDRNVIDCGYAKLFAASHDAYTRIAIYIHTHSAFVQGKKNEKMKNSKL